MLNRKEALSAIGAHIVEWPVMGKPFAPVGWVWRQRKELSGAYATVLRDAKEKIYRDITRTEWEAARGEYLLSRPSMPQPIQPAPQQPSMPTNYAGALLWAAYNVHPWPKSIAAARNQKLNMPFNWYFTEVTTRHADNGYRIILTDGGYKIGVAEWAGRRKERYNQPSTDRLPFWARFIALQPTGGWWAYENKPRNSKSFGAAQPCWQADSGRFMGVCPGDPNLPGLDWRETLQSVSASFIAPTYADMAAKRANEEQAPTTGAKPTSTGDFCQQAGRAITTPTKWQQAEKLLRLKGYVWNRAGRYWEPAAPEANAVDPRESTAQLQRALNNARANAKHLEQRSEMLLQLCNLMSDALRKYTK